MSEWRVSRAGQVTVIQQHLARSFLLRGASAYVAAGSSLLGQLTVRLLGSKAGPWAVLRAHWVLPA